eukprot:3753516-Prymnesium_polylepis.1
MAFILDAIRCGRAFDCERCGELGIWQSPRCDGCAGMEGSGHAVRGVLLILSGAPPWVEQAWGM